MKKEKPLIVASEDWAKSAPSWLVKRARKERNLKEVGDGELCLFLYTSSLKDPMPEDLANVYSYIVTKVARELGSELPLSCTVDELSGKEKMTLESVRRHMETLK